MRKLLGRRKLAKVVDRQHAQRLDVVDLIELYVTSQCDMILDDHLGPVTAVALSPCGGYAATACADAVVRVWDLNGTRRSIRVGPDHGGSIHRELIGHTRSVSGVAWSADGGTLMSVGGGQATTSLTVATRSDETVRLWYGVGRKVIAQDEGAPVMGRKFERGALHLAVDRAVSVVHRLPSALAVEELMEGEKTQQDQLQRPPEEGDDVPILVVNKGPDYVSRSWIRTDATRVPVLATENFTQFGIGNDPVFNGTYSIAVNVDDAAMLALGDAEVLTRISRWRLLGADGTSESELERIMSEEEIEALREKEEREAEAALKLAEEAEKKRLKEEEEAKRKKKKKKKKKKKEKKVINVDPVVEDNGPEKPKQFAAWVDFPFSMYSSAPFAAKQSEMKADVATEAAVTVVRAHETCVECCAYSPDGALMATGAVDGSVELRGTADPTQSPAKLEGHASSVFTMAFSADSSLLCTASADYCAFVWNLKVIVGAGAAAAVEGEGEAGGAAATKDGGEKEEETEEVAPKKKKKKKKDRRGKKKKKGKKGDDAEPKKEQRNLKLKHDFPVRCCAFDPQTATRLLTGAADGVLRLWRVDAAEVIDTLRGHTSAVVCCEYAPPSPKFRLAVSGSTDCTVRVWDMSRMVQLTVLDAHTSYIMGCSLAAFPIAATGGEGEKETSAASKDEADETGKLRLATASMDGTARVWQLTLGFRNAVDAESTDDASFN